MTLPASILRLVLSPEKLSLHEMPREPRPAGWAWLKVVDERVALATTYTGLMTREIEIVASYSSRLSDLRAVTELIRNGQLSLDGLVSHAYGLRDGKEAFAVLERRPPGMVRVVITA